MESWHQQASLHALVGDPPIIVLQLLRYTHRSGDCVKIGTRVLVEPGQAIFFPVFREGVACTASPYVVVAITIHLGDHLLSGHYRSVLLQAEGRNWGTWITDDGAAATKSLHSERERMQDSSYLVWLTRAALLPDRRHPVHT